MRIALREVKTECQKKRCSHHDAPLHRHHKGSQKLFVRAFERLVRSPKYQKFVKDYWAFRRKDIVVLCDWHHLEIHAIYIPIISRHKWKNQRRLRDFTWLQAYKLMQELENTCNSWLKTETPGIRPRSQ